LSLERITQESLNGVNIRKHNDLIEAKYQLPNLQEQRLILMLLSQIKMDDEDFKSYRITVVDFAEILGLKGKDIYSELDRTTLALVSRTVSIRNGKSFLHVNWLSSAKYQSGSGYIELAFDPNLKPYLLQLKSHYTQYKSNDILHFKSIYSIRLYELLKKEAFKARNGCFAVLFEYEQLREHFGIGKKEYALFAHFRTKTIEPAIKEISSKTDLNINDVRYGKTGRKITNITFCIKIRTEDEIKQQQTNLQIENKTTENENKNHPIIESLVSLGFSFEIAKTYKNKHGVKKIERNIAYTLAKKEAGLVKDVPAYLNMAIENDYGGGAWEAENQKKAQDQANKAQLEKEQLAKKAQEAKNVADKKTQSQQAFDRFLVLPQEQQEELRNQFMSMTDSVVKGKMQAALKAGEPFYTSPAVLQNFKHFIVSNKLV
jgi:plasmid replication initiation protein